MTDTRAERLDAEPDGDGPAAVTGGDRLRQVAVTLAELFCVVGTLVGVGVIGTRVAESSGGALAADATLLAPAGTAFSIWTPIYLGLLGYTIWQWLPGRATTARQRGIGWLVATSMVLNAGWLLVTQQGWLWPSVVVIVALLGVLTALMVVVERTPTSGWAEWILVDGTFGLYLGWVAVATCANVTATLVESGVDPGAPLDDVAAVAVLGAVAVVGVLLARRLGGRLAVAGATIWGLVWIAVGRTTDDPRSLPTALAAVLVAVIIASATARSRRMPPLSA
jgi:tryptophan-rich sensory protein